MNQMQRSEFVLSAILGHLLKNGINIGVLEFETLQIEPDFEQYFAPCFQWLLDEGLVRYDAEKSNFRGGTYLLDPVLTAKGLAMLGQSIEVQGKTTTVANRLSDISNGQPLNSSFGDFLGGILGGFTKSINS